MPDSLLQDLNTDQQEAVTATEGPILILAGAGSGKTRVLTYRAAWLVKEKGVEPHRLLLATFTNKAAGEMKDRIRKLLQEDNGQRFELPFAGTFHSFCAKFLRREGQTAGIPANFVIYDEADQLDLIKAIFKEQDIDPKRISPSSILSAISSAKNELISAVEYPQYSQGTFAQTVAYVYPLYQNRLKAAQALDFDDLLAETVRILKRDEQIAQKYQFQFRYILVDEYQDVNTAQYVLTGLLAKHWKNICVVGDASQAIYGFRGADFRNILRFQQDWPACRVFHLEQNYRSSQNILDAAFSVISKNTSHPILKLWTDKKSGETISLYQSSNEIDEANFIIKEIRQLTRDGLSYQAIAILYRTNAQSRVLEEAFLFAGLPYILVGGIRFYQRKEIRDVLAYLRLLANPVDETALKRITKLGKGRLKKFDELAIQIKPNFDKLTVLEIMDQILDKTNYLKHLDDKTEEGRSRIENVKELRSVASEFTNLDDFLENVALVEGASAKDAKKEKTSGKNNAVTLMTIHAAKGLEFPIVFLIGMEEGLFPHSRALMSPAELEEERRLCYVAITRAKQKLYLTFTTSRLYFGTRSHNIISRFISDIPEHLLVYCQPKSFFIDALSFPDQVDF